MNATIEQLKQLTTATWDGNLISKDHRSRLCQRGLATQVEGWNIITPEGVRLLVMLDLLKPQAVEDERDRAVERATHQNKVNNELLVERDQLKARVEELDRAFAASRELAAMRAKHIRIMREALEWYESMLGQDDGIGDRDGGRKAQEALAKVKEDK